MQLLMLGIVIKLLASVHWEISAATPSAMPGQEASNTGGERKPLYHKGQAHRHSQLATSSVQEPATGEHTRMQMRPLETAAVSQEQGVAIIRGKMRVNGPLPWDFAVLFSRAVGEATDAHPSKVRVTSTAKDEHSPDLSIVTFEGPAHVVESAQLQAADPYSRLANGALRSYLIARTPAGPAAQEAKMEVFEGSSTETVRPAAATARAPRLSPAPDSSIVQPKAGIDIDTDMPYGELEPFGREDTAQELTEQSVKESNEMVDQLERAEVSEEKRAVFRALTRLRGEAITSFDGIARAQTGNIDAYSKQYKWRKQHPLRHLAHEEADVSKWAFPDNAD